MRIDWLAGTLLLLPGLLPGQGSTQHALTMTQDNLPYQRPLQGRMRWRGSYLAGCDFCEGTNPIVWAADRQGVRSAVTLDIPDAGYIGVRDVAAGSDGSLTAVGLVITGDSQRIAFIAWIPADRNRQVITRVFPYSPQAVTVAPDGTIWTVGEVLTQEHGLLIPNELRHYATSGQVLASKRVTGVRKSDGGLYNVAGTSALMVSSDRIGWLTAGCQYIEFSLAANQLGTYSCPNGYTSNIPVNGVALSSANDLLLAPRGPNSFPPLVLNRDAGTWQPMAAFKDPGKTRALLGFDELELVTLASSDAGSWLRRYTLTDK